MLLSLMKLTLVTYLLLSNCKKKETFKLPFKIIKGVGEGFRLSLSTEKGIDGIPEKFIRIKRTSKTLILTTIDMVNLTTYKSFHQTLILYSLYPKKLTSF